MNATAALFSGHLTPSVAKKYLPWVILAVILLLVAAIWGAYQQGRSHQQEVFTTASGQVAPTKTAAKTRTTASGTLVVVIEGLNFRAAPGTDSQVVRNLSSGQQLTLLAQDGGWYNVKDASGHIGWVAAGQRFVRLQ